MNRKCETENLSIPGGKKEYLKWKYAECDVIGCLCLLSSKRMLKEKLRNQSNDIILYIPEELLKNAEKWYQRITKESKMSIWHSVK